MPRHHLLALALTAALALAHAPSAQGDEAPAFAGPDHPIVVLDPGMETGWLTSPNGMARIFRFAEGEGAFFAAMELEPGAQVPPHRDPTEEYILLVDGGGTLSLDGVSHELTPGSVVYMKPNAEVSFVNGPRMSRVFQIFAGPEPARKYDSWTVVPPEAEEMKEMLAWVDQIRTAQLVYKDTFGEFKAARTCPEELLQHHHGSSFDESCSGDWMKIGWLPDEVTKCQFRVETSGEGEARDFEVRAECDLDGDGVRSILRATRSERAQRVTDPTIY